MRKTLVINLDRCSGCDSCVTACKYHNDLPLGEYYGRVWPVEQGTFPETRLYWLPVQCQQCENPGCVAVCPTGAAYRDDETGTVLIRQETCIGCGLCIPACPYGARSVSAELGVAQKCTLCDDLTRDGGDVPVCVHNCPCGARFFGDLDDPDSDAARELAKYGEDCVHGFESVDGAEPTCRYVLSPQFGAWDETVRPVVTSA